MDASLRKKRARQFAGLTGYLGIFGFELQVRLYCQVAAVVRNDIAFPAP